MENLLEYIRHAATDPRAWHRVQSATESYLSAACSQIASVNHGDGGVFFSQTSKIPELDDHIISASGYAEPVQYAIANPHWRKFTDYDYTCEDEIRKSRFYQEDARFDIGYRLALRLIDSPEISKAIVWFWPRAAGHPQADSIERLRQIQDALRLSASVCERLSLSDTTDRHLVEALRQAGTPAIVAEPSGEVVQANVPAQAILAAGDGLAITRGTLRAGCRVSSRRLVLAMASAGRAVLAGGADGATIAVERPSGKPGYMVTVAPLAMRDQFLGRTRPLILLILKDPAGQGRLSKTVLAQCYDLTPAEAEVALHFARGRRPLEIAELRGTKTDTIRGQIKQVMHKTDTHRQSDLMRLLLSIS